MFISLFILLFEYPAFKAKLDLSNVVISMAIANYYFIKRILIIVADVSMIIKQHFTK